MRSLKKSITSLWHLVKQSLKDTTEIFGLFFRAEKKKFNVKFRIPFIRFVLGSPKTRKESCKHEIKAWTYPPFLNLMPLLPLVCFCCWCCYCCCCYCRGGIAFIRSDGFVIIAVVVVTVQLQLLQLQLLLLRLQQLLLSTLAVDSCDCCSCYSCFLLPLHLLLMHSQLLVMCSRMLQLLTLP